MNDETDQNKIGQNLQRCLQTVLPPEREQKHVEQRKAVPENNGADEQAQRQRCWTELRHCQFNGEQLGQDKNSSPNQPYQPIALVERRLHCEDRSFKVSKFQRFKVSKFPGLLLETL